MRKKKNHTQTRLREVLLALTRCHLRQPGTSLLFRSSAHAGKSSSVPQPSSGIRSATVEEAAGDRELAGRARYVYARAQKEKCLRFKVPLSSDASGTTWSALHRDGRRASRWRAALIILVGKTRVCPHLAGNSSHQTVCLRKPELKLF